MPSRLVRNCPGCAISAGTERSTMPPMPMRSSVTAAARVRPFAVSTLDVVGQDFQRKARGLGGFLRQHDRTRAGIERHRDRRAIDLRGHAEFARAPARDLDRARAARGRASGHQFGEHALGHVLEFEAVGISDDQNETHDDPEQRRLQGLHEVLAKEHQHGAAEKHQK